MSELRQNFLGGELGQDLAELDVQMTSDALSFMVEVTTPDTMKVTIDPDGIIGEPEIVIVTNHLATDVVATITRGAEGTTPRLHPSGIEWVHGATAAYPLVPVESEPGTSYTVVTDDNAKVKTYTEATLVTVTLPVGFSLGYQVDLAFLGAAGGDVVNDGTSTVLGGGAVPQNGRVSALVVDTDTWLVT